MGYGLFSLCVIHKEGLWPSSGDINRQMMMMIIMMILLFCPGHYTRQIYSYTIKISFTGIDLPIQTWLVQEMISNSVVGIDPTTYTRNAWSTLEVS
jgi:hypothetical protein